MKSVKELLDMVNPLFDELVTAKYTGDAAKVRQLLNTPQPVEWIVEEKSRIDGEPYEANKLILLEGLMDRIFPGWNRRIIAANTYQEKSKFAVTSIVRIEYGYISVDYPVISSLTNTSYKSFHLDGIATVVAPSIEYLETAGPICVPRAFKNAVKQLGNLFGKSLNREGEEELPVLKRNNSMQEFIDSELENIKHKVSELSWEEGVSLVSGSGFKYNQEVKKILDAKKPK